MSALIERITFARQRLIEGGYGSEAAISAGVVLPVLDALGWPTYDPSVVVPEYRVETRRVDFALLTRGTPAVFVEVKQPGTIDGADRQLFEYAFHVGVPMAVLTDGATWHVYLPAMQGSYDERRVYLLDLAERPPEESAERLARYLARAAVESGEAEERAKADYKRSRQRRGAAEAIPQAWASLVGGESTRLVDVLAAEVQTLSGFQPHPDDVEAFLLSLAPSGPPPPRPPRPTSPRPRVAEPPPVRAAEPPRALTEVPLQAGYDDNLSGVGFSLDGHFQPARNGRDVLIKVFQALDRRDPSFLDRFIALPTHGRTRRFLARSPEKLFPTNPSQAKPSTTAQIKPGYWVLTKLDRRNMAKVCQMAADEADVTFGRELQIRLQ